MRKTLAALAAMTLATSANAAVVTFYLSLHESPTGQVTANNQFAIYASVSQGDNAGLFAYGVDLKGSGDPGGPTTMTLANRTPSGKWDVDPNDPNFDPGAVYPTKYGGFGAGRSALGTTGIVSGVTDLSKGTDLVPVFGIGQTAHRMDDFRPPPDTSSGLPVAYAAYVADSGSDGGATPYGNPPNPVGGCGGPTLPAGTVRIATGSWTGTAPSIENLSVNTKASVWKLNHPNGTENEIATLQFAFRDIVPVASALVSLSPTVANNNQAVGGAISVSGSNGKYVSEVDELLDPAVNRGSAPIAGIGDEAGSIYVMAKLNGSAADIANLINGGACGGGISGRVDATDPQFALLHSAYDAQFGGGGFNLLMRFPNIAGAKVFNWDFGSSPVTIDKLAAVPEPNIALAAMSGMVLLRRRRR